MKTILIKLILTSFFLLAFIACDDNMGETDSRLTDVKNLIEPANDKEIALEPFVPSTIYFEWDYVTAEESGTAVYQIAFDKTDGDFSNPVYLMNSDNNGYQNHVSVSHLQMDKIAGLAGIPAEETGTFKWTIFSQKGLRAEKASSENKITITRLPKFGELYITGEGSEGGGDISKALKMKDLGDGTFEVYTKLTADKPFYFVNGTSGKYRKFSTANGIIKLDGTTTVPTEGVYKITFDTNTGNCTYTLITRLGFFFCPDNTILFDIPYDGYGVFKTIETVTFKQEEWGRDQRYKFRMFIKENGGIGEEKEVEWGTLNETDEPPASAEPDSYYYLQLFTNTTQWDNKWKLKSEFDGVPAEYTVYLTADQPYTHMVSR